MRLNLDELRSSHPKLEGIDIDYAWHAAVALQRAGHAPGVSAERKDGTMERATLLWEPRDISGLSILDRNRLTEDAAEGVALSYIHALGGWTIERRLQRREYADWLLERPGVGGVVSKLALEVSGTIDGDARAVLRTKLEQVGRCTAAPERRAVVVELHHPQIHAGAS